MTDTFFDLQRFAADVVLGGTSTGFEWDNGQFVGGDDSTANVGSATNPAYWATTGGVSAVTGSEVYLTGKDGYSFSIQNKEWSLALADEDILKASKDGNHAFAGTNSTLDVDGTFEENVNGIDQYVSGDINATVGNSGTGTGLLYTFEKDANDVDVALPEGTAAIFGKNSTDITLGVAKDSLSISGLGFKEGITAANTNGEISFVTGNNTITLPAGVLDLKTYDGQAALLTTASIAGAKSATLTTSTGVSGVTFNETTWNEITGNLSSIAFDSVGSATVDNSGAVTVDGAKGAQITIKNLDIVGAEVNGLTVSADPTEATPQTLTVGFTLDKTEVDGVSVGGISAIDVSKATNQDIAIVGGYSGDFDVVAGSAKYNVAATIAEGDYILFNANASQIELFPTLGADYNVTGGDARYTFEPIKTFTKGTEIADTLNGAEVSYKLGSNLVAGDTSIKIDAKEADDGISTIYNARVGDQISVASDADGFTANFNAVDGSGDVTFEVNGASINAANIDGRNASFVFGADSSNVTVSGLTDADQVSVYGGTAGMTYHFKDGETFNAVKVAAGETMFVTLDSTGAVEDYIDEDNYKKLKENDQGKWDNISSIGNDSYIPDENGDPVAANRSSVYEEFYDLDTSEAGLVSVATFANEDATVAPETVSNPTGVEIRGSDVLAQAGHITLSAGSAVRSTPINIQRNESSKVFDVTVDLRSAGGSPTVALGTLGEVTASHEIYLSNNGVGNAWIGSGATGQNIIHAGTAGAQIRHDGERATIEGNSGNDTIWAGKYDIVTGGAGADRFYDSANYTILDYDATQDALIGTRIGSVNEIDKDILNFGSTGNEIGFGSSNKLFTIGKDQNASLNLKVAVMDTNADVVGTRNVVVAGINGGALDASSLDGAALIVADYDRNVNSGDNVIGSAYGDNIYVGANDTVNGGAGNDYLTIDSVSSGAGVTVELSAGRDTIAGWQFGFDKNAGATELIAAEGYQAEFDTDRLKITDSNGSILIDDTSDAIDQNHGEAKMLINGTKWMAIRTDDENKGYFTSYGNVESNDEIADFYIAEREGFLRFESGVTEDLGEIHLSRYYAPTNYQDITYLKLDNNSKADVYGTSERETVDVGGEAAYGANKRVSLGAGNDVIISSGDSSVTAGHMFYFGANDGLDTIRGFGHYLGIEQDPDKQYADTLVVEKYGGIYTGTGENGGSRIDFYTEGDNRISIFETEGISVDNLYQIKVGEFDTKLAKIGNSNGTNTFTYASNVDYYVGSSADNAQDTLNVGNEIANANVWLDGTNGTYDTNADEQYYRGIAVVNASAETNTNVSLAGNGNNNTLYGGGAGTNNYLWGGAGDNVLIGSMEGQDTFFYVRSAGAYLQGVDDTVTGGNDEVYNYNLDNGDIVWLGDTTLDDIASTEVNDNSVVVNFKNGGSLTVDGSDDVRFLINSGTESYVTAKDSSSDNKWIKEA